MYLCTAFFTWVLIAKLAFIGEKIDFFGVSHLFQMYLQKPILEYLSYRSQPPPPRPPTFLPCHLPPCFTGFLMSPQSEIETTDRSAPSKMTCNSANGDPNSDSTSDIRGTMPRSTFLLSNFPIGKLDWRNVLLGIGGLYGAAGSLAPLSHQPSGLPSRHRM